MFLRWNLTNEKPPAHPTRIFQNSMLSIRINTQHPSHFLITRVTGLLCLGAFSWTTLSLCYYSVWKVLQSTKLSALLHRHPALALPYQRPCTNGCGDFIAGTILFMTKPAGWKIWKAFFTVLKLSFFRATASLFAGRSLLAYSECVLDSNDGVPIWTRSLPSTSFTGFELRVW